VVKTMNRRVGWLLIALAAAGLYALLLMVTTRRRIE